MLFHGFQTHVSPEFRPLFEREGIRTPEDVIARWSPGKAAPGLRSRVNDVRAGDTHLFVKTYHYAGLWWLRTWGIPARARREFENLTALAGFGLRVSAPVAWGARRTLGFLSTCFLATRAIENAIDLRELAVHPEKCPFTPPGPGDRRKLIEEFARALRRCHDGGWFIHTAFFKNLLLTRGAEGYALWMIDVPFAHIWRNRLMPGRAKVRDFATLAKGAVRLLTKTERMRFCKAYGVTDRDFLQRVERYRLKNYPH